MKVGTDHKRTGAGRTTGRHAALLAAAGGLAHRARARPSSDLVKSALARHCGPVACAVPRLFRLWLSPAAGQMHRSHRDERIPQSGAHLALSRLASSEQPRCHDLSRLRHPAACGAALSDRRHLQSVRVDVHCAGGDRGGHAGSRQHADPGSAGISFDLRHCGMARTFAVVAERAHGIAAALSGRHLVVAGHRYRFHLDLCVAHRKRKRTHVGGTCRRPARAGTRTPSVGHWRAGDGRCT